jgi:hypothetical protein
MLVEKARHRSSVGLFQVSAFFADFSNFKWPRFDLTSIFRSGDWRYKGPGVAVETNIAWTN